MVIDGENQIGSFHRSASWQITHLVKNMSPEQRAELNTKMKLYEATNNLRGRPINTQLLDITQKALKTTGVS